jgi:hypothetical protein
MPPKKTRTRQTSAAKERINGRAMQVTRPALTILDVRQVYVRSRIWGEAKLFEVCRLFNDRDVRRLALLEGRWEESQVWSGSIQQIRNPPDIIIYADE